MAEARHKASPFGYQKADTCLLYNFLSKEIYIFGSDPKYITFFEKFLIYLGICSICGSELERTLAFQKNAMPKREKAMPKREKANAFSCEAWFFSKLAFLPKRLEAAGFLTGDCPHTDRSVGRCT